jgi:hypothetical protein
VGGWELQEPPGGRKCAKEPDLTRGVLLEYAKKQGAVTIVVGLLSVTVQYGGHRGESEIGGESEYGEVAEANYPSKVSRVFPHLHNNYSLYRRAIIMLMRVEELERSKSR